MEHFVLKEKTRYYWPLHIALLTLLVIVFVCLVFSLSLTNDHLTYALDDAYIHMAMAKNLAQHGVYGVTQYEFSSSSSSPLWTLLLAFLYSIFGVSEPLPFILNFLLASTILIVIFQLLRNVLHDNIFMVLILLAVVFFTPFPAMIFSGMEHLLHILLTILYVWLIAHLMMENTTRIKKNHLIILFALTVALVITRYESYALICFVCLLLLIRRFWKISIGLLLTGIVPIMIYQTISVRHGMPWLPNSVFIRSRIPDVLGPASVNSGVTLASIVSQVCSLFMHGIQNAIDGWHITVLVFASCLLLIVSIRRMRIFWTIENIMLLIFILMAFAHFEFGNIGHFFRYEAYLSSLGIFVLAYASGNLGILKRQEHAVSRGKKILVNFGLLFVFLCLIPQIERGSNSLVLIPQAARNIYEQQYQMGMFLHKYYPGVSIAINDIGAVTFLGDVHLLDLVGLASVDVLKLKKDKCYTTDKILHLSRIKDVHLAIVYDTWLQRENLQGAPSEWIKVGEWKIENNVVCSSNIVSFYAVKTSEKERLIDNLRSFSSLLPKSVGQYGLYTVQ